MGVPSSLEYTISQSEYWRRRGKLSRFLLRLRAYVVYPIQLLIRIWIKDRAAVTVISSNTFYAPAIALAFGPKFPRRIHWVLDLYPDVLVLAGHFSQHSWRNQILTKIVAASIRRSAINVFLGHRLQAYARKRFGEIANACVIPIGADGRPFRSFPPKSTDVPIQILYAGNLGRMHDVATIESALRLPIPSGIRIRFCANGGAYEDLVSRLGTRRGTIAADDSEVQVTWGENLGEDQWVSGMLSAHVALVLLRPGAELLVMPSKTYSALVAGQAILAICPLESDLADLIRKHECGWVIEPGDVCGFRSLLAHLAAHPNEVHTRRQAAFRAGHEFYDERATADNWHKVLRDTVF